MHKIKRTSLLITLAPYFIANFHGLSQNESQGVQFQSRASNVEFHLCYLAIVLPTFNACSPAKWVQIWESNPILGAYEARDLTACPICNKYGQVGLAHKRPITRRLDRNIGATGGDRIHDVSYVAVFETAPSQPSCGTVAYYFMAIKAFPQVIRSESSSLLGTKTITSQPALTRGRSKSRYTL